MASQHEINISIAIEAHARAAQQASNYLQNLGSQARAAQQAVLQTDQATQRASQASEKASQQAVRASQLSERANQVVIQSSQRASQASGQNIQHAVQELQSNQRLAATLYGTAQAKEKTAQQSAIALRNSQAEQEAAQETAQKLQNLTSQYLQAGVALEKAFSPRIIQSQSQISQAVLQGGRALGIWTNQAQAAGLISASTAGKLREVSVQMQAVSNNSKIASSAVAQWQQVVQASHGSTQAVNQSLGVLDKGIGALGAQINQQNASWGGFVKNATLAQQAGQGLVLSFSLAQIATGNLQQGLFGLGFSLLFAGEQMRSIPTLAFAGGMAALSFGVEKLIDSFKEGPSVIEQISDALKDFDEKLAESRGFTSGFAEELSERLVSGAITAQEALAVLSSQEVLEQAGADIEKFKQSLETTVSDIIRSSEDIRRNPISPAFVGFGSSGDEFAQLILSQQDAKNIADELGLSIDQVTSTISRLAAQGVTDINLVAGALLNMALSAGTAPASIKKGFESISATAVELGNRAREEMANINESFQQQQVFESISEGAKNASRALQQEFDAATRAVQEGAEAQSRAVRDASEAEVQAIRDASDRQLEERRRVLDIELDNIKTFQDAVIDARRVTLDDELDAINNQHDARIRTLEATRDKELDISKERIEALKAQEKELSNTLDDLQRRRQEAIRDALETEAEVAELERIQRTQGDDPNIGAQLSLRKARLDAIRKEDDELQKQIGSLNEQLSGLENLIDAEDTRQDRIKKTYDLSVDLIKDELNEAQDAARQRADNDIDQARRAFDNTITLSRQRADEEINQIRRSTEERIHQIQRSTDDQVRQIQRGAEAQRRALQEELQSRQDSLNKANEQRRSEIDRANEIKDRVLPLLEAELEIRRSIAAATGITSLQQAIATFGQPGVTAQDLSNVANILYLQQEIIRILGTLASFQGGGIVPGPVGEPRMVIAHGGERIIPNFEQEVMQSPPAPTSESLRELTVREKLVPFEVRTPPEEHTIIREIREQQGDALPEQGPAAFPNLRLHEQESMNNAFPELRIHEQSAIPVVPNLRLHEQEPARTMPESPSNVTLNFNFSGGSIPTQDFDKLERVLNRLLGKRLGVSIRSRRSSTR